MSTLCLRSVIFRGKSKAVIRKGNSSLAWEMLGCTCSLVQNALKVSSLFQKPSVSFPSRSEYVPIQMQSRVHATARLPPSIWARANRRAERLCVLPACALPSTPGGRSPLHALQPLQGEALRKADTVPLTKRSSNSLKVCSLESC